MKQIKYILTVLMLSLAVLLLVVSCSDDSDEQLALERQFKPSVISTTNGETSATITWNASLFTTPGEADYLIEVSTDQAGFNPVAFTTTTKEVSVVITDDKLAIKQDYYARVKAVGTDGTGDSRWTVSSAFRILGEQFLNAVTSENVIDESVRLTWRENAELTNIVLTSAVGTPIEVELTDADKSVTMKQVDGLLANTTYTAEIFAGSKSKGTQVFTTKAGITGSNVIDLRGTTGDPNILVTTLDSAPSGSVIVLKRGESYAISAAYLLSKSVSIVSGLDFGTDLAMIKMTSNFNLVANSAIDSLVFKDVIIKGSRAARESYNSDYVMNANAAGTIGKIRFDNCVIKILRGVIRLQAAGTGTKVTDFLVNNCVIDSVREYGIVSASGTSSITNIRITNTTMFKARRFIVHSVAGNASLLIDNSTFNELPEGANPAANYFIDYGSQNTGSLIIRNSILGKVWETTTGVNGVLGLRAGTSTTANVTNTYSTSDFVNTSSPISGLSSYPSASTTLFTDPSNGNFKIKDANFVGKSSAGDPRWR